MSTDAIALRLKEARNRLDMWKDYAPKSKSEEYTKRVTMEDLSQEIIRLMGILEAELNQDNL